MGINDGWQGEVQTQSAVPLYRQFWDGCEVIENDTLGSDEYTAQILDFGDVDKIIRIGGRQIHMAQRFRKPYYSERKGEWCDPDFTLRYSRPTSDNMLEYERLMNAYTDGAVAYPRRYAFGRVHNDHTRGLYELYILDTDKLIESIVENKLTEDGPIPTEEGQGFMSYDVDEIASLDIITKNWVKQTDGDKITDDTDIDDGLTEEERERIKNDPVLELSDFEGEL